MEEYDKIWRNYRVTDDYYYPKVKYEEPKVDSNE